MAAAEQELLIGNQNDGTISVCDLEQAEVPRSVRAGVGVEHCHFAEKFVMARLQERRMAKFRYPIVEIRSGRDLPRESDASNGARHQAGSTGAETLTRVKAGMEVAEGDIALLHAVRAEGMATKHVDALEAERR